MNGGTYILNNGDAVLVFGVNMYNEAECICYKFIVLPIEFKHEILNSRIPELILDQRNVFIIAKSDLTEPIYVVNAIYFRSGQMHYRYGWEKSIFKICKIYNTCNVSNEPTQISPTMFPMHTIHTLLNARSYTTDKNNWFLQMKKIAMNPFQCFVDGRHDFYNFRLELCELFQNNLKSSKGMNPLYFKTHAKAACVFEFIEKTKVKVSRDITNSQGYSEYVHEDNRIVRQVTYPQYLIWIVQEVKILYPLLGRNYYSFPLADHNATGTCGINYHYATLKLSEATIKFKYNTFNENLTVSAPVIEVTSKVAVDKSNEMLLELELWEKKLVGQLFLDQSHYDSNTKQFKKIEVISVEICDTLIGVKAKRNMIPNKFVVYGIDCDADDYTDEIDLRQRLLDKNNTQLRESLFFVYVPQQFDLINNKILKKSSKGKFLEPICTPEKVDSSKVIDIDAEEVYLRQPKKTRKFQEYDDVEIVIFQVAKFTTFYGFVGLDNNEAPYIENVCMSHILSTLYNELEQKSPQFKLHLQNLFELFPVKDIMNTLLRSFSIPPENFTSQIHESCSSFDYSKASIATYVPDILMNYIITKKY